jgi:hypothetical protein
MNLILEQVKPETISILEVQAKSSGLSIDDYLKSLMGISEDALKQVGTSEFIAAMESLGTESVASVLSTYSRTEIYFDHD